MYYSHDRKDLQLFDFIYKTGDHYEEEKIITRMKSQLGKVHIKIIKVENIDRTKAGKLKAVISEIKSGCIMRPKSSSFVMSFRLKARA